MAKKALILNGEVVDVAEQEFEVHSSLMWVDCPDEVMPLWLYDGSTFTNPFATTPEQDLHSLRLKRNDMLSDSDWVVVKAKETGTNVPQEWLTYRQALRDITINYSTIEEAVWPVEPEA